MLPQPVPIPPSDADAPWKALVARVLAHEPGSTEELFQAFDWLQAFFYREVGPEHASDCFHQIIVDLISQIQEGALRNPERIAGYVKTIARRQVAAHRRGRMLARSRYSDEPVDHEDRRPSVETQLATKELRAIASRVLQALPVRDREVLVRFYILEQPQDAIQEELSLSPTQFRLMKSRAKTRFVELCRSALARNRIFPVKSGEVTGKARQVPPFKGGEG